MITILITTEHLYSMILTLLVATFVGVNAARKVANATDFTVGGRQSGATLVAGTIIGTIIGGSSTIGTAQLAFSVGLSAWWFTLGAGLALLAIALFYARPLRGSGLQTIPEYLVANYGSAAGPLTSLSSSIGIFFAIVANLLAATSLVTSIFSYDALQATSLVCALVLIYVLFGGVWGTGHVGTLKAVLIYATLLAVGWISYLKMGGFAGYYHAFPPFPWYSLFGRGVWVDIGSALALLVGTISTQTYIQAIYGARDVKTAQRGAVLAALITLPSGIPAVMVGMFMRVHHPDISPISALPLFILYYLPPWFGGLAMAALLLAAIGSGAGLTLGVSTMLSRDILSKAIKGLNEQKMLWLNRSLVLLITLLTALFAFGNFKSLVLEWNFLSMGLRGAGVFLPLTAAVFLPGRFSSRAVIISMVASIGSALAWKCIFPKGIDPLYVALLINTIILAVGYRRRELKIYSR